ncbi:DUF2625 family protein [Streptomyces sp. NPDC046866]|uniref:DUF2625 family protein n=1 Tax=Streptomyces sp. NPDC046866 TaxID=3154921 RepID=UPI0034517FEF
MAGRSGQAAALEVVSRGGWTSGCPGELRLRAWCDDAELRDHGELIDVDDPAWPLLLQELSGTDVPVEVLLGDPVAGRASLLQLQVSARSNLGGIVLNCGGLLVDGGWLRIFASPSDPGLPGLAEVNAMPSAFDPSWRPDGGLVVAHDVLGGVFVLNGGDPREAGRPGEPGEILYFAPDALRWEALGAGHSAWLSWILSGGLQEFYEGLRWDGWRSEVSVLNGRQGLSFFPPLWSAEARRDLSATGRRTVPVAELLALSRDACLQLDGVDPGFLGVV